MEFRARRLKDPLRDYTSLYPASEAAVGFVVDALDRILVPKPQPGAPVRHADRVLLGDIVFNKQKFQALRALTAPPISEDDLNTLLQATLSKTALRVNQALADDLGAILCAALDPKRFPWIASQRSPTQDELRGAKEATTVLINVSAVHAQRRSDERAQLEGAVAELLTSKGYIQLRRPARGINDPSELPEPGHFIPACKLAGHNADLVVRLKDGRMMAIECKASNSEVNGWKRLNKEVVVDAQDWYRVFGRGNVVAAALRGVHKPANVEEAQRQDVYLFWWHRLPALSRFLDLAVPPKRNPARASR